MKKIVYYTLISALSLSLCACSSSNNTISGSDTESGKSFVEVSDPFDVEDSSKTESNDTVSGAGDGYDDLRNENPDLFTEDYIEYMKQSNSGISWDNWQFKVNGKECSADSSVTYSGGEMEINFSATTYTEASERSDGYMIFIGGTPQVITLNGSEPSIMATEVGKDSETKECKITFTPRLTKEDIDNKDDLKMTIVDIANPLYLTAGRVEKFDYEHSIAVASQRTFKLEGECEIAELISDSSFELFSESEPAVKKYMRESLQRLEEKDTVRFELYSKEKADKPIIKDGKADIALLLYGGKQTNAVYKVFFYVNHEPVKVDGCDYITAELKEGFVAKYSVTIDDLKERDFVYAIAISESDANLSRSLWAMKTDTRRLFASD